MKNFDKWNEFKKNINQKDRGRTYKEQEIWWCSVGVNVGLETDGTGKNFDRPVLVIKGLSRYSCLVIPLTSSLNKHPLRPDIGIIDGKPAKALLSQIKTVDSRRFIKKIEVLDLKRFVKIRKKIKDFI